MKIIDIEEHGLEFKNLVSGPATPGRVLNYIYKCGNDILKHKNGYRYTNLENDIGSAWTTELMIGLGYVSIGAPINDTFILNLTKKGKDIYEIIRNKFFPFNEGSSERELIALKSEINSCEDRLYDEYKQSFINSIPFQILKEFLKDNGYYYPNRNTFMDDYFETVKKMYDTDPSPYNRNARTTTAQNRVPSLLQFCFLFELLRDENGILFFDKNKIESYSVNIEQRRFTEEELTVEAEKEEELITSINIDALVKRYGIYGNRLVSSVVREGRLQTMFKHNLLIDQHKKCIICGMKNPALLIASHIKPAAECNTKEKVDYNNGLLLCCNHDRLFDQHLITFDFNDGRIEISKVLDNEDIEKLGIDRNYSLPEELMSDERVNYLMEHNITFNNLESKR